MDLSSRVGQLPIVVSLSGGLTSAYMLRLLLDNFPGNRLHVAFANTGRERRATRDFVAEIGRRWGIPITWLEAVVHPAKGQGTTYRVVNEHNCARPEYEARQPVGRPADWAHPFEAGLAKYGIANRAFPWCSRELKSVIIDKWARDVTGGQEFLHAIGIRYDEEDRRGEFFYPLYDWQVTKPQVEAWWARQPFTLGLKNYQGNCDLCWKKSLRKNLLVLAETPRVGDWWRSMEQQFHTMPAGHVREVGPHYFHHSNQSTADLVQLVESDLFYRAVNGPTSGRLDYEMTCTCGAQ